MNFDIYYVIFNKSIRPSRGEIFQADYTKQGCKLLVLKDEKKSLRN